MLKVLIFILFFSFHFSAHSETENKKTICLNMIVKNEKQVIRRCLESVSKIIDYWVIVDTGSEDNTPEIINDFMAKKNIKGELHHRQWKNFAHNRNEALELAKDKADYILFMDADDLLVFEPEFNLGKLNKDCYLIRTKHSGSEYDNMRLVKSTLKSKWVGVLHEYLDCPYKMPPERINHVYNYYTGQGARSQDPDKYIKDAAILEEGLKEEPNNERYVFYLAQSYKDANNLEKALENYQKRVSMGGWNEEVYYSLYQIGALKEDLKYPSEEVVNAYFKAFSYRPSRIEALYKLINLYKNKQEYQKGFQIGLIAEKIPNSKDLLFVEKWMEDYGILFESSICAYWSGNYEAARDLSLKLCQKETIPYNVKYQNEINLGLTLTKIVEEITNQK